MQTGIPGNSNSTVVCLFLVNRGGKLSFVSTCIPGFSLFTTKFSSYLLSSYLSVDRSRQILPVLPPSSFFGSLSFSSVLFHPHESTIQKYLPSTGLSQDWLLFATLQCFWLQFWLTSIHINNCREWSSYLVIVMICQLFLSSKAKGPPWPDWPDKVLRVPTFV